MRHIAFAFATLIGIGIFTGSPDAKASVVAQVGTAVAASETTSPVQEAAYRHHHHRRHHRHHVAH
jgi:hypothetical protein